MLKAIRYILLFTGLAFAFYGVLKDYDPLTLIGAFLISLALMLNPIIKIFKKPIDQ